MIKYDAHILILGNGRHVTFYDKRSFVDFTQELRRGDYPGGTHINKNGAGGLVRNSRYQDRSKRLE